MIEISKNYEKNTATVLILDMCEVRVIPLVTHCGGEVFSLVDVYRVKNSPYVTTSQKWQKYDNFESAVKAAVEAVKVTYEVKVLGMAWRNEYVPVIDLAKLPTKLHPYFTS